MPAICLPALPVRRHPPPLSPLLPPPLPHFLASSLPPSLTPPYLRPSQTTKILKALSPPLFSLPSFLPRRPAPFPGCQGRVVAALRSNTLPPSQSPSPPPPPLFSLSPLSRPTVLPPPTHRLSDYGGPPAPITEKQKRPITG